MHLIRLADLFEKKTLLFRRSVIYLQLYLVYGVAQLSYAFMLGALQSTEGVIDVAVQLLELAARITIYLR